MSVAGSSQDQINKWMMQFDGSSAKTLLDRAQKIYEEKIWFLQDSEDGKIICTCTACRTGIFPLKVAAVYQTFLLHQCLMNHVFSSLVKSWMTGQLVNLKNVTESLWFLSQPFLRKIK